MRIKITWRTPLRSKSVCFSIIACFVGLLNVNYWTGYLAPYLKEKYKFDETFFGYMIMSQQCAFVLCSAVFLPKCKFASRKFFFMVAFLGLAVSQVLLGPTYPLY